MEQEPSLAELQRKWIETDDGETAQEYGLALEAVGRIDDAAAVHGRAVELGYLSGNFNLAWIERERGNVARAIELLEDYLASDDDPDEFTLHVTGVLGHWRWYLNNDVEAEPLLRRGLDHWEDARADLASLLKATGRLTEAIAVLRSGVALAEVGSFIPLANIVEEAGDLEEAESLLRRGFALGDAFSAYNLYVLLKELDRVEEAQEWLWLAAAGGDELAIRRLTEQIDHGEDDASDSPES
ncbi:hypothetical protein ACL9RL_09655 [Plantibacter sp. Mn2098]|uniref:hypothetical protein n=1 Tax=Plantibacter sp. Mn2098 TaxID=3395266 RepID=UPI003BC422EF